MEELEDKKPILLRDLGLRFPTENSKQRYRYGLYKCGYCGKEYESMSKNVNKKDTKGCGCQIGGKTHGLENHRLYGIWASMLRRCYNTSNKDYIYYGGKGITVCKEWKDTPAQFIEDMFPSFQEGLSLDRIDVKGNYEPSNCRWTNQTQQCINRGMFKNNSSGFVGVSCDKNNSKFASYITVNKKRIHLGYYLTAVDAVQARNKYIIDNKLTHKLSIIPDTPVQEEYLKDIEHIL